MKTKLQVIIYLAILLSPFAFSLSSVFAQSPQKISYQAVVRDASDDLVTITQVGMQISILQGYDMETTVYVETQTPITNANGLLTVEIGGGATIDDFSAIDWADGPYFIKTEIDPAGSTAYSIVAISQLLSVPYALHAKTAENATGGLGNQVEMLQDQLVLSGLFIRDVDGNLYRTVTIGDQVWLGENLKTTRFKDGNPIPKVENPTTWAGLTAMDAFCWYDNNINNKEPHGALYNWFAVLTGKLCPEGWRVPTDDDWTDLSTYLGGETVAGSKLKETGTSHWESPNTDATNETGFTALPGGFRGDNGSFSSLGIYGLCWSSTEIPASNFAYLRQLNYNGGSIDKAASIKKAGISVRCLKE